MKSKELKDMIDTFFSVAPNESAHPIRVARKTINGRVHRLFQMHGVLAGTMLYGFVEIVTNDDDDDVTGINMIKRNEQSFETVQQKYNKMGDAFIGT